MGIKQGCRKISEGNYELICSYPYFNIYPDMESVLRWFSMSIIIEAEDDEDAIAQAEAFIKSEHFGAVDDSSEQKRIVGMVPRSLLKYVKDW